MKRFMTLMLAFPLALTIAGAAMIGVTFATVGDGGDAAPQGGDGIAETATASEERFTVGENDCWQKVIRLSRDSASGVDAPQSAAGAEAPADWSQNIRFCNFAGDITVITNESFSEQWIPNVLPADAIAA